ncbi:MAG: preprotein translocase subunit SecE [Candidatus Caldatribacteriota bacterium]|jgi:preprotein translocase subunit SecE|nr:preprotein translocase subunit SecE [Atribacterota bacterium]MDD3031682.1 preprotein translocase subunit SecE [Atribacterota bacterium]MDD4288952.1 preprotein translocase subunit SecE [Atribacterota bacterium]MDD4765630.1 preprotein translocase subunit SecE [Atribacterota bacterium]MDI9596963.1 preprotein translocase subunit SecE [Atribacterota bacterium]
MKSNNLFHKIINFIKEARAELKKVTWPNRKQLVSSTIVVMITVVLVAIFLGIVDLIFSRVVTIILQ